MLPGPTIIIKCPHCGQHAKRETLLSSNTFGASLWSDCKQIAPMHPEFPKIVLCSQCNQFYWVEDAKEVDSIWYKYRTEFVEKEKKWAAISFIDFPTYQEYQKSLDSDAIRNRTEEIYVRVQLWWLFNDHFRGNNSLINLFPNRYSNFNKVNIEKLFHLLDKKSTTELLMKAEILRNQGRFDDSRILLESITDKDFFWIRDKYLKAIEMKNPELFRLR